VSEVPSKDLDSVGVSILDVPASNHGNDVDAVALVPRNSKSRKEPAPTNLGFYSGDWLCILISAKMLYRCNIHTVTPFPERNDDTLEIAHDFLLEAVTIYLDTNKNTVLDYGSSSFAYIIISNDFIDIYNHNKHGMIALVSQIILHQ
jgi:hypothetical protein